jgi:glycosyltransferase domain-containing protein
MTPRLTIVMPLKGRHLFTFRFLWHANKMRLPYRFLIADGNVKEAAPHRLEDSRKLFPDLDIEYIRYPDDTDYSRYFTKMADAFRRVRTPYAMNADNDDFLGFNGIERALDFLDTHKDYVCARGHQITFSVYSGIGGSPGAICGKLNSLYSDRDSKDIDAPTSAARLRQGGLCHRLHYAVYRTEVPVCIWREVAEINFSDLMLFEDYFALRALTLGKAHIDSTTVSYYSQSGTGISYQPLRDWAHHLLRSRFTSDVDALVTRLAATVINGDRDPFAIAEDIRSILTKRYREFLSMNYGLPARIKGAMRKKWPRLANYVQTRPRFSVGRERSAILSQLNAGANQEMLKHICDELTAIEQALSGEAFDDYAGPLLPMVQTADRHLTSAELRG